MRQPPPVSPAGQPLADFADRLLARLIDGLLLGAVLGAVSVLVFLLVFASVADDIRVNADGTLDGPLFTAVVLPWLLASAGLFLLALLSTYLYEVEMVRRSGQTIGKRLMKIRIVPFDPSATLDRGMATRRWLIDSVAGSVVPGLTYVDGLWQLWDQPYRQCLHDKFAHTVVVKVPT